MTEKEVYLNATRFMGGADAPRGKVGYDPTQLAKQTQSKARKYASGAYKTAAAAGTAGVDTSYFDRMLMYYDAAMAARQAQRQAAYEAERTAQQQSYERGVEKVNAAADKALQEAYVERKQAERRMQQELSAQGLNGGASESSISSLENRYGRTRSEIEAGRAEQVSALETTLQSNLAKAQRALNEGAAADLEEYADKAGTLYAANAKALTKAETQPPTAEHYRAMARTLQNSGQSREQVEQVLRDAGLSEEEIRQIFAA